MSADEIGGESASSQERSFGASTTNTKSGSGGTQLEVEPAPSVAFSTSPPVSPGAYAPSPNTSSVAVTRANQLRIQNLLRKLLLELDENVRIDTLRVLRKTLRELNFELSWLTQVDLLETIERLLRSSSGSESEVVAHVTRGETQNGHDDASSWRLVHDCTQLLIESLARLPHDIDEQLIESMVPSVVENLGHRRSEVRRASLLLLNALLHHNNTDNGGGGNGGGGAGSYFKLILRLFIDYGLTNYRNKQAQRGAILSLPLLMSEQLVRQQDLAPLIRCLSELLLVDANEQLFYSLYLAMQRLQLMMGDAKFQALLSKCEPEAAHLYWQAASRNNSLVPPLESSESCMGAKGSAGSTSQGGHYMASGASGASAGRRASRSSQGEHQAPPVKSSQREPATLARQQQQQQYPQQHVTFESSESEQEQEEEQEDQQEKGAHVQEDAPTGEEETPRVSSRSGSRQSLDGEATPAHGTEVDLPFETDESESEISQGRRQQRRPSAVASNGEQFSSDVSSTCSSDAHLVNPAHYMTKAALAGNPLDHYEEIHHVDHSNKQSLAINDFGPICNTPTMEFVPQLASSMQNSLASHFAAGATNTFETPGMLATSELKFGIFPKHLIQVALASPRASDRYEAMQELMCIIRESPINHLAILMTYFDSFLEQFLSKILLNQHGRASGNPNAPSPASLSTGTDFKIELIGIDMIETLIIKTKVSTMQYIRPIVSLLMRALIVDAKQQAQAQLYGEQMSAGVGGQRGTSKRWAPPLQHQVTSSISIVRENTCRVLHKMMAYLPPQHVIDALFEHKHQKAPVVREEAVNRVTAAILEYDKSEFNLTKLCYHILPMLADPHASVRLASLECIATLANALGPERIGSLLTAAEAVQSGCDYDNLLLAAINARLMRHALPRCQSNGIVRFALKPFLGLDAGAEPESLPADVRWVLEAPSSHQQHPGGPYYHPGAHHHHHHQHQQHLQGEIHRQGEHEEFNHQHHRLGVYSPPTQAERRRRSSVGLALLHHEPKKENGEKENGRRGGGGGGGGGQEASGSGAHRHHHTIARQRSTSMVATKRADFSARPDGSRPNAPPGSSGRRSNSDQVTKAEAQIAQNGLSKSLNGSGGDGGGGGGDSRSSSQDKSETYNRAQPQPQQQQQPSPLPANVVAKKRDSENEQQETSRRRGSRVGSQPLVTAAATSSSKEQAAAPSGCRRRESLGANQHTEVQVQAQPAGAQIAQGGTKSSDACTCNQVRPHRQQQQQQQSPHQQRPCRRSNSQDSVSSTDTNKVLFQYYLGKFRQSLAESPGNQAVLPSDSIIYTDVEQAYEQTRHRTRFQQTSFDYELGLVGRVPDAVGADGDADESLTSATQATSSAPSRRRKSISQKQSSSSSTTPMARQQDDIKSGAGARQRAAVGEDSATTSGSESPQTVYEATRQAPSSPVAKNNRQQQQQQQQQQKQRPILTRSGKSIQRQATLDRSTANEASESAQRELEAGEDGNEERGVTGRAQTPGPSSRRQSVASNTSGDRQRRPSMHKSRTEDDQDESRQLQQQQQQQQQQEETQVGQSGRESRATSKRAELAESRGQRSKSGSRASDSGERQVSLERNQPRGRSNQNDEAEQSEPSGGGRGSSSKLATATTTNQRQESETTNSSSASERPSGRESRRRRSSSQRRRGEAASSQSRPPSDRAREEEAAAAAGGGAREEHDAAAAASLAVRRRASRSQPPVARARQQATQQAAGDASRSGKQQQQQQQQQQQKLSGSAAGGLTVPTGSGSSQQQHHHHQQQQQQQQQHRATSDTKSHTAAASRRAFSVSPSLAGTVNVRQIFENVAELEGPFAEPQLALKVAMSALESPCWSTKVEGILAFVRLVAFHAQQVVLHDGHLHEIVSKIADETRNLRSAVSRSAIFALGDFCARLGRTIEPELDTIVHALLLKSNENTAFIREDIRRALSEMLDHLTPWRLAGALLHHGAAHKSVHVRRMTSQFVAALVERMGAAKCLAGAREISAQLLPAAAKFAQDQSPHTRFYGRQILAKLVQHNSFDRLMRRNLSSTLYRSTIGVVESVKRRGPGEPPADT